MREEDMDVMESMLRFLPGRKIRAGILFLLKGLLAWVSSHDLNTSSCRKEKLDIVPLCR
jgi:hypothetical protein